MSVYFQLRCCLAGRRIWVWIPAWYDCWPWLFVLLFSFDCFGSQQWHQYWSNSTFNKLMHLVFTISFCLAILLSLVAHAKRKPIVVDETKLFLDGSSWHPGSFLIVTAAVFSFCLQFLNHQQALGGGAGGAEGEQRQTDGGSARVHRQRQTVEAAAGGLSGGGRAATQTGTAPSPLAAAGSGSLTI